MLTSHDIVTSIQLLINCNLTVCIFQSIPDNKDLFLFCATEDPKDKIRRNASKRYRKRYILSKDYSVETNFFQRACQNCYWVYLIMDPILKADRELSENIYFNPILCIVFVLWLFVLRHVATPQNRLYLSLIKEILLSF